MQKSYVVDVVVVVVAFVVVSGGGETVVLQKNEKIIDFRLWIENSEFTL